jgi:hypothetical protein
MRAHSKLTESGNVSFYGQSIVNVAQRALRESGKDSYGERENNTLSKALQTKKQRGRVRGVSSKMTWKEGFLEHKSMYLKRKMTSTPQVDVEELTRQLRREVLGDLRPILEASGIEFPNIDAVMSDEERWRSLASTTAGGERPHEDLQSPASGPSIESDMIDNLVQPTTCNLMLLVGESFRMEVRRGLVYLCQTMLDNIQIDTSFYVVVKVDKVHDNSKDLKLELPPDDTTLTMRHAVARRVRWRWTSIVIDPAATASASTSPASMSLEARLPPSPNPEQMVLSPIREQLPPIIEKP